MLIADDVGLGKTSEAGLVLLERRIPFIKWGHLVRYDPVEIREWVDGCRHRPDAAG